MTTPQEQEVKELIFPDGKEQDEIFASYVKKIGKECTGKLHQFFSPKRIPEGLSKIQAMICVRLLPLRKKHTDFNLKKKPGFTNILNPTSLQSSDFSDNYINPNFSLNTLIGTLSLPNELVCDGSSISKMKFYLGITKLLYRAVLKK